MTSGNVFFDTGELLFRTGEDIFINKVPEIHAPHLHMHDFIEIAYVASGRGIHRVGENEYNVSKGDLFIINYNVPHEFRSLPDTAHPYLSVYNCIFRPRFIDYSLINCRDFNDITWHFLFRSLFPDEAEQRVDIKLLENDSLEMEALYEKMHREYHMREEGYIEILRAYVIELLVSIFRQYRIQLKNSGKPPAKKSTVIEKAIEYLKQNYSSNIRLEDIAAKAFLSYSYFGRLFKEYTGMTVSEYIQKLRMEEACRLLKSTSKKVTDIASDVGYTDIKFFYSVFRKVTGKTPAEYRKV